jgi:hypothetical protein
MASHLIACDTFQEAWIEACRHLLAVGGESHNLFVSIRDPLLDEPLLGRQVESFCRAFKLRTPKQVAYTIFPANLSRNRSEGSLALAYNRENGFFERVKKRYPRRMHWGTYFRRLTSYPSQGGSFDQLGSIINAINARPKWYQAAYSMIIQRPGSESTRPIGGPCLNYLALQGHRMNGHRKLGLLAVYRNHDFVERAYGNYLGLGQLLGFICRETGCEVGELACLSSHAYVEKARALRAFLAGLPK